MPLFALEVALVLVQTQASVTSAPAVWLLTANAQLARGGSGAALVGPWGMARSARAEVGLPLTCIDGLATTVIASLSALKEPEVVVGPLERVAPRLKTTVTNVDGLVRLHFHTRGAIGNLYVEPQPDLAVLDVGGLRPISSRSVSAAEDGVAARDPEVEVVGMHQEELLVDLRDEPEDLEEARGK